MDSGALSRAFFDAFHRRDLDTMISMMAEDVRYEMPNSPVLTSRDAVREASRHGIESARPSVRSVTAW